MFYYFKAVSDAFMAADSSEIIMLGWTGIASQKPLNK
jgi:hypothetical protein